MGKVHGSLARAGKVSASPSPRRLNASCSLAPRGASSSHVVRVFDEMCVSGFFFSPFFFSGSGEETTTEPALSSIPVVCCVPSMQVRGQCPKVAKQDKKKKPKGRAGKRITVSDGVFEEEARAKKTNENAGDERELSPLMCFLGLIRHRVLCASVLLTTSLSLRPPSSSSPLQYNRRFVNVVVGLGKKRSPNSNAT